MKEKRFILINRIIFLVLLLLNILLPIILLNTQPELELLDSNVYCEYDEISGYSNCEVELTFNKPVAYGDATIYFYDVNGDLIDKVTPYFSKTGTVVSGEITLIQGEIDSYELDNLDFSEDSDFQLYCGLMFVFIPLTFVLFITSLLLSYKKYEYNGQTIEIYAGYYNHYIKVNGEKYDEHKTLVTFSPIVLSCTLESGDKIQATISLTNRVSLKINDKLYTNKKY